MNAEAEARQLRNRIAHVARITTLGEMVAGIAHEINQPLAAITNYTDASKRLLASGTADPEDLMHAMKQASAQAHRAAKVLQRLRDFAKLRSVPREKVELNALITDVVSLATLENPDLRSTIALELEKDLPQLQVDPVQIQQVILNLIRNGVDAMQECGTQAQNLTIRTVNEGDESIRVEVVDRGPGVDEKVADQIFDPFYSTKLSGMGLGLSICRSIARAHGGQLDFSNNASNGATFVLRLPTMRN
jgi:two-component system, LuxR family, sensor kinase FixL